MTILDDIKRLSTNDISIVMSAFISIVAPGFLTLYLFKPNLIVTLDTSKLIFFSIALALPVVITNFLSIAAYHPFLTKGTQSQVPSDQDRVQAFVDAMALASIIFYPSILTAYLFGLSFRHFLIAVAVLQLVVFILEYSCFRCARSRNP